VNCEPRTQSEQGRSGGFCLSGLRFPLATFLRVIPAAGSLCSWSLRTEWIGGGSEAY